MHRRRFLTTAAAVAAATRVLAADRPLHIATNVYPWLTFYGREGKKWDADLGASLAEVAKAGLHGIEPLGGSPDSLKALKPLLAERQLHMRSLYSGARLHDAGADAAIQQVTALAAAAHDLGCRILVVNPDTLGGKDKSDDQLRTQAANMDRLGAELKKRGVTLAYHNHDVEMRQSAREFHHMMNGTDPAHVSLCLDAHWVFRGSGNSQVCLFDVVKLYGKRVVELHLRQSRDGIWTEAFGEGDIDHPRLAAELFKLGVRPHVVLEQAVEGKTPKTMSAVEAHAKGVAYAADVFRAFA